MKNSHVTRVLFAGAVLAATLLPATATAHVDDVLVRTSPGDTINVEWNAVMLKAIRDT